MTKKRHRAARSPGTVLVVDPDDSTRRKARALLESLGYRVLDSADAAGAEQLAKLYVGPIHALLIEVDIPGPGGQALVERLGSLHPQLRALFTSVQPQGNLVKQGRLGPRLPFVRKPFEGRRLAAKLRSLLGGSR